MSADRTSRFELKYIITEEVSLQIRDFIRADLELDEHAAGKPNYSYPVHSLYLDSDDLTLFWTTINGDKDRFKLRLRFYDDNAAAPVFFEVKQRIKNAVTKKRAAVDRDAAAWLLAGDPPKPSHLVINGSGDFPVLEELCERMYKIDAHPKIHVAYSREAYVSQDNSARLTMDREVRAAPLALGEGRTGSALPMSMPNPTLIWGHDVVLELKFVERIPDLFSELERTFSLRQCGAAKYVDSVATLGEHRLG